MTATKFGIHVNPGSRNGYGDFCRAGAAGCVVVNEDGAAHEMKTAYPASTTVARFTSEADGLYLEAPHGIDQWTPEEARRQWREVYAARFERKWRSALPCNYYVVINEGSDMDLSSLPAYLAYEDEAMQWCHDRGYRLCILNLAGGTPESFDFWKEYYVPHIQRANELGHVYGRHIYNLEPYPNCRQLVPLTDATNLVFRETQYLRSVGCDIGVIVTECATCGGQRYDPAAIESQVPLYDAYVQDDPSIIFWAWFTIGRWEGAQGDANCQDSLPWMTEYIRPIPAQPWTPPDIDPIPPPNGEILIYEQYFDKGWWDRTGSQQIPNPMKFYEVLGFNPYATDGTGGTHNQFLPSENRILDKNGLPPDEWDLYLNESGWTNKNFKKDAPIYPMLYDDVELAGGKYRLEIDFVGDWFEWINGGKVLPNDPKHAFCELFLHNGEVNVYRWVAKFDTLNLLSENKLDAVFDIVEGDTYKGFGFALCSVWGADNNGAFVRSFKVWQINDDNPEPPPSNPDIAGILEKLDHIEKDADIAIQKLNHILLDVQEAREMLLALDCGENPEPIPPPSEEFYGVDLSHHNNISQAQWDDWKNNKKVKFALIRLTFGTAPDAKFGEHYKNATDREMVVIPYGFPVDGQDPVAQAEAFITELAKWGTSPRIMNDVEPWQNRLISARDYEAYVNRIKQVRQGQLTYSNKNYYDSVSTTDTFSTELHVADWVFQNQPVTYPPPRKPILPTAFSDWRIWQVCSTGFDGNGHLDINVFNGTLEEFYKWAQTDTPPDPPPPNGDTIDLLPYFNPPLDVQYMVRHPDGSQERFRTEYGDGGWYFVKNHLWEHWLLRGDKICLASDISPAPQRSDGTERYYIVRENGLYGASWCNRYMKMGQTYSASHNVQFYAKSDCRELSENSGPSGNNNTFVVRYASKTWNGITLQDVIEIGNPDGEMHWFARGYGRVAWRSGWGESAISEIVTGQAPMEREIIPCMAGTV